MPQETNLNISPYFDDFEKNKNYYKVLFKPGYPIQARELTTIQSILQNQIEQFGSHFFKEGAKVIPGNLTYNRNFSCIKINDNFSGIPVSLYLKNLVGMKIYGRTSGVSAKVLEVLSSEDSELNVTTLYVDYIESSSSDLSRKEFFDDEVLVSESPIRFGNIILPGEGFASTLSTNSSAVGSAFSVSNGIYFLRGTFVEVSDQTLILDQYNNNPSYRIGFTITEEIITSDFDDTLYDNAQGYNNYSSPGADRLKITATLSKKGIDNFDDNGFVQLATIEKGILREPISNTDYNILNDELARRTFDESGHYYVRSFTTYCKESLNNELGNGGIFNKDELTYDGSSPSEDLAIYKISPGKAYVKGYEVEFNSSTFIDAPKPRTTKTVKNQAVNIGFGPTLSVNSSYGSPLIGFNTTSTISLRDNRVGQNPGISTGIEIGVARVYDYSLEQGGYDASNLNSNVWDLTLFDVQMYSILQLNEPITISTPTYVIGESTGATGFLKNSVTNSSTVVIYEVNGEFSEKENVIFDSSSENNSSRYITNIRNYKVSDIKSVYSNTGVGTFSANTIQYKSNIIGNATISKESSGISTITLSGVNISGIVTSGNILQYTHPGISTITYVKVDSVDYVNKKIEILPITNVAGIVNGDLPKVSDITVNDLSVLSTKIQKSGNSGNPSDNDSLFSVLPKQNIKNVELTNSELIIRKQFSNISITSGSTNWVSSLTTEDNSSFLPFDEERYILIRSNGAIEPLTADKFQENPGSGLTQIRFNNLGANDTNCVLIATLKKTKVTPKAKRKKVVESIIVNKSALASSGIGSTTLNDGLVYGNYPFGTRVQDREICLNYPDVHILYGIFESNSVDDPQMPSATMSSMDGPTSTTNDLVIGENVRGTISGAKAIYAEKINQTKIGFIYTNSKKFISGETIVFEESNIKSNIIGIDEGGKNITDFYVLNDGQKKSYYDYSSIVRKSDSNSPNRKIKIVFSRNYYDTSDTGDITTVNSYNAFNYTSDINSISNYRLTDILDFRPRVNDYVVMENISSPFEFSGRKFNGSNHSSKHILASDESVALTYEYYLPRIDRIYLTKDKKFSVKYGNPSDNPSLPEEVSGAMNIANVYLPPYLYNASDAQIEFVHHKRYQMKDIFNIENRLKTLENYTSLSLLETSTQNLFISDESGLNRFKSGFYVDNFSSLLTQDTSSGIKNSIDTKKGELRPAHYTTNIQLEIGNYTIAGIGSTSQENLDKRYSDIVGFDIKRSGDVISLDYSDVSWLKQPFATRTENVTPFFVKLWEGSIELFPSVDVWIDTNRLEFNNIIMEGSFLGVAEALNSTITSKEDGERIGVTPVIWNSWETTGIDLNKKTQVSNSSSSVINTQTTSGFRQGTANEFRRFTGIDRGNNVPSTFLVGTETTNSSRTTTINTTTNETLDIKLSQRRVGRQQTINESIDVETLGDRVVSRDIITFMRSSNIQFTAKRLKPYTQIYPFFDGVNVSDFCFSKLVEIEMLKGTFVVGETVVGTLGDVSVNIGQDSVSFRVAKQNHKYGPYNNPTDVFDRNPYNREDTIPELYSATSTILNVDTFSLSDNSSVQFGGVIRSGMILRGQLSGSEARVTGVRLITDRVGTIIGSYRVPNGVEGSPRFETGRSRFKLTSSPTNSQIPGVVTTVAEETFYSQGSVDSTQETTLSLRNARVDVDDSFRQTRNLSDLVTDTTTSSVTFTETLPSSTRLTGEYRDPLAQSFIVDDQTGIFVTKVDLYFRTKDNTLPVTVQIREVELGTPNQKILPFSEVELTPDKVNVSEDASVPTTFAFESPVYLEGQKEYAIVVISNSNEYNVWISRLGESDISTLDSEQNRVLVTTQRLLGSLFKSQNASTWSPSQYEDLTFELYRANFKTSGFTQFFNSPLPESLEVMIDNPLTIQSNNARISLSSTITNAELTLGNTIIQETLEYQDSIGNLIGYSGSASGSLAIVNSGIGYTPSSGTLTYFNVPLTSITGSGVNATANITITNGSVTSATISSGGEGYVVGDILEASTIGTNNLGFGMRLSVSAISGINELIVDNIQGEFITSGVKFINSLGITTDFSNNGTVLSISNVKTITDGKHVKVFHRNHGMHSEMNIVELKNIKSDVPSAKLSSSYPSSSGNQTVINLDTTDTTRFSTFENAPVSAVNPGYVRIFDEILSYTGVNSNTLTGVTREIDETRGYSYVVGDTVEKYELGGVSLRRINKVHNLSDVDSSVIKDAIGPNHYYIQIDMSSAGKGSGPNGLVDRSNNSAFQKLNFNESKKIGGSGGRATYNLPYEMIIPNIKQISPSGTSIKSTIRTVSGTSLGGKEVSFVDQGFQDITNGSINYFDSPRLIASKLNESAYLGDVPANKSININIFMSTSDSRVSPVIDLSNNTLALTSNLINNPISDYSSDSRINKIQDDPNIFTYVSDLISLENSASSIKVLLDAYLHINSDIRVLYSIGETNNIFVPFPGYKNIDSNGTAISLRDSDGLPDTKPTKQDRLLSSPNSEDFREYTFTANELTQFKKFRIKIIGTSTTQAFVPIIKNLRVIALA
jgi:hypothetical protein